MPDLHLFVKATAGANVAVISGGQRFRVALELSFNLYNLWKDIEIQRTSIIILWFHYTCKLTKVKTL